MKDRYSPYEEARLAERVIKLVPEVQGIARTADQYIRDPRVVEALVVKLEKANGV